MSATSSPILEVRNLTTRFRTERGTVTAVDDVSFDVFKGETLGIVGESGCGKTVTSKSIMRLLPERTSSIDARSKILLHPGKGSLSTATKLDAIDLATASPSTLRKVRGDRVAMIFQEPMTSLNPVFRIGWQLDEVLKYHTNLGARERRERALEMLKLVEMPEPERRLDEYPHQLSGGMRQRVMIAMALCCEPDILIADEPTTALDVTIQAQILALMENLKKRLNTAIILITHNLGVVAQVCDRVMVMYAGRVIETGTVLDIFYRPQHPYTRALLDSIPKSGGKEARAAAVPGVKGKRLPTIEGIVPSLFDLPKGCRFNERCPRRQSVCIDLEPALLPLTVGESGRAGWTDGTSVPLSAIGDAKSGTNTGTSSGPDVWSGDSAQVGAAPLLARCHFPIDEFPGLTRGDLQTSPRAEAQKRLGGAS